MAAFTSSAGATKIQLGVVGDRSAYTRANGGIEHALVAQAGSPQRFRQPGSVGVVVYVGRKVVGIPDFGGQRKISPARKIRRVQDCAALRIDRPGRDEANAADVSARIFAQNLVDSAPY